MKFFLSLLFIQQIFIQLTPGAKLYSRCHRSVMTKIVPVNVNLCFHVKETNVKYVVKG